MIEIEKYQLPEIVDHEVLNQWQRALRSEWLAAHGKLLSDELKQFIDAAADQMSSFGQIRVINTMIIGSELLLCGMKEIKGQRVDPWTLYPLPVPYMVAVDHRTAMQRIYVRRGRGALVAFVKAHVNAEAFPKLMDILSVHVFHEERPAFRKMLREISKSKEKITV